MYCSYGFCTHTDPSVEIQKLTSRLQQEQSENAALKNDVQRLRDEKEALEARVAELEETVKQKDAKVDYA